MKPLTTEFPSSENSKAAIEKQCYTVKEFLAAFGISNNRFYDEVNAGRLSVRKLGKRTLVTRDDAMNWLNNLPKA